MRRTFTEGPNCHWSFTRFDRRILCRPEKTVQSPTTKRLLAIKHPAAYFTALTIFFLASACTGFAQAGQAWGTASPGSLNFGSQPIYTANSTQSVQFVSNGTAPLNISSISVNGDFSESNSCPAVLSVGSMCTVYVTFAPTASGTRLGYLYFNDNAANSAQVVSLSGIGGSTGSGGNSGSSGVPWGAASPGSLNYGTQQVGTANSTQSVQFVSNGTAPLSISSISVNGDFSESNSCPAVLSVGSTCTVYVTFAPTTSGTRLGYLYFNDNAANSAQVVSLSGTGSGYRQEAPALRECRGARPHPGASTSGRRQ